MAMPYPAYRPSTAGTFNAYPPNGPFNPSSVSSFNSVARNHDDARIISRTPSPTPSEAQALSEGLFSWKQLSNWRFWIRKEWTSAWPLVLKYGYLVPIGILFVISFPPLFGHEIVAILCGLVWGLWIGFAIVCAGTFIGEVGNFYAFKWCCRARGEKMERTQIPYACLARCVRDGGFKIALIARFSAIPGHFTTAVFSTCGMNIFVFSIAAILSLPKQFITVYLGVILESSGAGTTTTKSKIISDSVLALLQQQHGPRSLLQTIRYGFDEVSGNFQQYNFGRGGAGNDAVIANAQDGSGFNNANFMTPLDGQNGRMRMYLLDTANPYRDGDFEAGIVIHELSHGLSTRLTGGPLNSGCLPFGESGGMGEGWGDFLATTIRSTANYSDYAMGSWAANRAQGIRNYPYSLNETINPSTYKTLDKPGYFGVHAIGEVWAQMLWVVSQGLIEQHGFLDNLYPPAPLANGTVPEGDFYRPASGKKPLVPKHGNSLIFQLVLNAMKLQPCRPGFFEARDAIILADTGFSSKGLGPDANVVLRTPWGGGVRTDDFEVPLACDA
ncbi:Fungalysin metallopeptidase-domain-containing protein [Mycena polygramma]|nr:Fungalysin metallopeptidase-domain-containing protein [Mycena polygramma]